MSENKYSFEPGKDDQWLTALTNFYQNASLEQRRALQESLAPDLNRYMNAWSVWKHHADRADRYGKEMRPLRPEDPITTMVYNPYTSRVEPVVPNYDDPEKDFIDPNEPVQTSRYNPDTLLVEPTFMSPDTLSRYNEIIRNANARLPADKQMQYRRNLDQDAADALANDLRAAEEHARYMNSKRK